MYKTPRLNRDYRLCVPLLRQRPNPIYHQPLKVFARAMGINSSFVPIDFPQGKHIRLFAASPDCLTNGGEVKIDD
jgi:hypothetical protein